MNIPSTSLYSKILKNDPIEIARMVQMSWLPEWDAIKRLEHFLLDISKPLVISIDEDNDFYDNEDDYEYFDEVYDSLSWNSQIDFTFVYPKAVLPNSVLSQRPFK